MTTPKDNPKIDFEYAQGVAAPVFNTAKNREITVRYFETGGAPPPGKAVKRLRVNEQAKTGQEQAAAPPEQHDTPIVSIEDIMTPAPSGTRRTIIPMTLASRIKAGIAGSSTLSSPPAAPSLDEGHTPARQLNTLFGDANPPPTTPKDTTNVHIQVSKSGRKLPAQGPRAGSSNSGVEQND